MGEDDEAIGIQETSRNTELWSKKRLLMLMI